MKRTTIVTATLVALLTATGCTDSEESPEPPAAATTAQAAPAAESEPPEPAPVTAEGVTPDPDSPSAAGAVDWTKYDEGLQATIDDLAAADDCDGLQEQFSDALDADAEVREATGSGSEDLAAYIDERLQSSECS